MDWTNNDGYRVTDAHSAIDLDRVHWWLSEDTYWALGRSRAVVERSIAGSLVFGLFAPDDEFVGFCRMVTDRATFAWLCDVYVARPISRNGGGHVHGPLAVQHPDIAAVKRQVLATADAHGLYEKFGFRGFSDDERDRWMVRDQPEQLC